MVSAPWTSMPVSSAGSCLRLELNPELGEDRVRNLSRCAGQRVGAAGRLRERNHLADVRLTGLQCDEALDPEREAAVGRRAHLQRIEEPSEPRACLLIAHAHGAEDPLLD